LFDALPVGLPHVHARRFDASPLPGAQLDLEELVQGLLLPLPPKPQRLAALQVASYGQEFLFLAQVDFIYAQLPGCMPPS
jgi:hypothetical protein